jgi:hypothetical protein
MSEGQKRSMKLTKKTRVLMPNEEIAKNALSEKMR